MMMFINTIITIIDFCGQSFAYCNYYQMITGIDVLSMLENNQLSIETMNIIINTVNTHMVNIASEISLTDADLWELLRYVIQESGNTNIISAELLESLGLYTNSIIAYLNIFGYIIR
jgi:hypothetical protein